MVAPLILLFAFLILPLPNNTDEPPTTINLIKKSFVLSRSVELSHRTFVPPEKPGIPRKIMGLQFGKYLLRPSCFSISAETNS